MYNGLSNLFRRFRRDEFEGFFKGLFTPLKPIDYLHHPADEILRDYLSGRLGNRWRLGNPQMVERLMRGELNNWQRAEVSAHVMTCKPCAKKLSEWRAVEQAKGFEQPRRALRWAFRAGALATFLAFIVALAIWLKPPGSLLGYSQHIIPHPEREGSP